MMAATVTMVVIMAVVVAFGPVCVAMLFFFVSGIAHFEYFDIKVQRLTRKRMIAVDLDLVALERFYGEHDAMTIGRMRFELHAGLEFHFRRKLGLADRELQFRIHLAVTFSRRDFDFLFVADLQSFQRVFQSRHNLLRAMEIGKRSVAISTVQDLALIIFQGIEEVDDFAVGDGLV